MPNLPEKSTPGSVEAPTPPDPLEIVLHAIRTSKKEGFPAVSSFLKDIYQALHSEQTSAHQISNLILKDVALTSSVLKTVNSSFYAYTSRGVQQVSTISRSILLLGVEGIANLAAALNVFETFRNCSQITTLKKLTVHSLLTGAHARELSRLNEGFSAEQAFIFGMMNSLGHMLVAFYLPEQYQRIEKICAERGCIQEQAAVEVLGVDFRKIGLAVAGEWHLPDDLRDAISGIDAEESPKPAAQKMRAIIACSEDMAGVATVTNPEQRQALLNAIRQRYEKFIPISADQQKQLLASSYNRIGELSSALQISRKDLDDHLPGLTATRISATLPTSTGVMPPQAVLTSPGDAPAPADTADLADTAASGQPDVLLGSLDDIVGAINNEQPLNDVLMMVLETIYRALHFDHVLLALLTPDKSMLKGRVCVGSRSQQLIEAFQLRLLFPRTSLADVIVATKEISAAQASGFEHVPSDFLAKTGAKSFILLPLTVKNTAIGAIYAQRADNPQFIGESDKRNLRLLRNYAAMAIRQCK
jgi:HD-like signal output (HDOD) protein